MRNSSRDTGGIRTTADTKELCRNNIYNHRFFFGLIVSAPAGVSMLIMLEIALVVLMVLWCSHHPTKRLLGFSRLFLIGGLLAFGYLEFAPLMNIVMPYLLGSFMDWVNAGAKPATDLNQIEMFFVYHLSAGMFLIYSLLMSAVCYFLQPRTEPAATGKASRT